MGAKEFGRAVGDRMDELGWSQNKVARRFGELPDGRGLDSTQVRMLKEGQRRLDHALVERLIHILGWDQDPATELKAWATAGLWPEDLKPEDITDLSELLATRRTMAAGRVASLDEGASFAAPSASSQQRKPTTATSFASREKAAA
jgi:hypothetical protein